MENIYLIELQNETERFFKIGTTVHRFCRFYEFIKVGYKVRIIYMVHGVKFYEALNAENILQSMFTPYTPKIKFGGYRECFISVPKNIYIIKIHSLITGYKSITDNLSITWR